MSENDYYPFGMAMCGRSFDSLNYRYGFNGKEKDESGEWGSQTHYDYGFRIYNPGIARFLSVDPLTKKFPWYTPYQFAGNTPIVAVDLDGAELMFYDEGKDMKTTAQNIRNAGQINYQVFSGFNTQGGLDAAPVVPVFELNPEKAFISRQEIFRLQTERIVAEINQNKARAKAEADFAEHRANTSNLIGAFYFSSGISDGVAAIKYTVNGQYGWATASVFFAFAPGSFDGAAGKAIQKLDPHYIRFSQSSVNGADEIVSSMKKNGWKGDPIDVVHMPDGGLTTIDNTRVLSASEANVDVQAIVHKFDEPLPSEMIERFTTKEGVPSTWGEAVQFRINKQKNKYKKNNPSGSYNIEGKLSN